METELRYFLQQGPTTVKELARLTGKSTSTIYRAMKGEDEVVEGTNGKEKTFHIVAPSPDVAGAPSGVTSTETTTDAEKPAPAPSSGRRGRKSGFAGQKLFPAEALLTGDDSPQTYVNPRRASSHGFRSLQLIIDNPGITTEDYLAKGGRPNDLKWDISHGSVRAEG